MENFENSDDFLNVERKEIKVRDAGLILLLYTGGGGVKEWGRRFPECITCFRDLRDAEILPNFTRPQPPSVNLLLTSNSSTREMPRRSSRKTDTDAVGTEVAETTTPRKTRQASVKVETVEVDAKIEPSPAKSLKKRAKSEAALDSESLISGKESSSGLKIARVKADEVVGEAQTPKQRPRKRIATADDDDDAVADKAKKTTKKRKTKEEKEGEAMPLAARTVVGTLKNAMHIGAHVSAAGGWFPRLVDVISDTNISVIYRCTKLDR